MKSQTGIDAGLTLPVPAVLPDPHLDVEGAAMLRRKLKTWVVLADGARGQIFLSEGPGHLETARDQVFIGSRLPGREIEADRPGRTFDSAGEGRHAYVAPTDPRRKQKEEFARAIAAVLEDGADDGSYERLVLVAPPKTLGDLRALLSKRVARCVSSEVPKNLIEVPMHELPDRLRDVLKPPLPGT